MKLNIGIGIQHHAHYLAGEEQLSRCSIAVHEQFINACNCVCKRQVAADYPSQRSQGVTDQRASLWQCAKLAMKAMACNSHMLCSRNESNRSNACTAALYKGLSLYVRCDMQTFRNQQSLIISNHLQASLQQHLGPSPTATAASFLYKLHQDGSINKICPIQP